MKLSLPELQANSHLICPQKDSTNSFLNSDLLHTELYMFSNLGAALMMLRETSLSILRKQLYS